MPTIDYYRAELKRALPQKAFLRIDRGDMLFVSDAPRFTDKIEIPNTYNVHIKDNLLYINPNYEDAPKALRKIMTALIKLTGEQKNKKLRQTLAVSLRLKDTQSAEYLKKLLREDEQNEA